MISKYKAVNPLSTRQIAESGPITVTHPDDVQIMKKIVPEYLSVNSEFVELDNP
jgi:hypothetical protein